MEQLRETIKAIRIFEPPEMSYFGTLIAEMESACPSTIWRKRQTMLKWWPVSTPLLKEKPLYSRYLQQ